MKKHKIILLIIFSVLFSSCGFKPLIQKNNNIIYIQDINVIAERKIAYTLKNNIKLISNTNSKNKYNVEIKVEKNKSNKIKDGTGKVIRYNISLTTNLELINLDNNNKLTRTFVRSGDHNVATIHSQTIINEKNILKIIIQQITDDIINFITFTVIDK